MKKLLALFLMLAMLLGMVACASPVPPATTPDSTPTLSDPTGTTQTDPTPSETRPEDILDPDGEYNSKEDVALYIHLYGRLPRNYVTKGYCKDVLKCSTSRVEDYWPGGAIGGDVFQNREGLLPKKAGRTWTECDINTWGRYSRGAERIVFSNDGLVYYTANHYASFELLYGDPNA